MRASRISGVAAVLALATVSQVCAQERAIERLELTMTLLPEEAQDSGAITRRIELPPPPAGERPAEPPGADQGQGQQGLDTATEARERGREFGQSVAEQARENRENAGRGDGPPDKSPGPPADLPTPGGGPPDNVGGGRPVP